MNGVLDSNREFHPQSSKSNDLVVMLGVFDVKFHLLCYQSCIIASWTGKVCYRDYSAYFTSICSLKVS